MRRATDHRDATGGGAASYSVAADAAWFFGGTFAAVLALRLVAGAVSVGSTTSRGASRRADSNYAAACGGRDVRAACPAASGPARLCEAEVGPGGRTKFCRCGDEGLPCGERRPERTGHPSGSVYRNSEVSSDAGE